MTLEEACTNVAKKALKVGDFINDKIPSTYFYKIVEVCKSRFGVEVYSNNTGKHLTKYGVEYYPCTEFYKRPIKWSAEQK